MPRAADGPSVTALVAASPPLDPNSAYCNLLQCSDFADTCVVAERAGQVVAWVSGYRRPAAPDELFIWQVAVARAARGQGLARRMLGSLLARPPLADVTWVVATITADNQPSWRLFEGLARRRGVDLARQPCFDQHIHFGGSHASEWEVRVGPLSPRHAAPLPGDHTS